MYNNFYMKRHIKKFFIPNEENQYQPHSLRKKTVFSILAFIFFFEILVFTLISPITPFSIKDKFGNLSAIFSSVLVEKTNETRLEANKEILNVNDQLVLAAQLKANDMAQKGYFAHTSPEGYSPWYFISQSGYRYSNAGENLAVNFVDSNDVHRAWLNSPTHKENILRDGFKEIGIATAKGEYKGKEAIFVVQYFGTPLSNNNFNNVTSNNDLGIESSVDVISEISELNDTNDDVLGVKLETDNSKTQDINIEEESNFESETLFSSVRNNEANVTFFEEIKTSPRLVTTVLMFLIAVIVLIATILKIFIKPKIQFPSLILNGLILILIIILFIFLNDLLVEHYTDIA
jgi:hypothetical protein